MSTKTLRKRIALVAVSALGFGLVSVAPASASATTMAVPASQNGVVGQELLVPFALATTASAAAGSSAIFTPTVTGNGLTLLTTDLRTAANGGAAGVVVTTNAATTLAAGGGIKLDISTAAVTMPTTNLGQFRFMPTAPGSYTLTITASDLTTFTFTGATTVSTRIHISPAQGSAINVATSLDGVNGSIIKVSTDTPTIMLTRPVGQLTSAGEIALRVVSAPDVVKFPIGIVIESTDLVPGTGVTLTRIASSFATSYTFPVLADRGLYEFEAFTDANGNKLRDSSEPVTAVSFRVVGLPDTAVISLDSSTGNNGTQTKLYTGVITVTDSLGFATYPGATGAAPAAPTVTITGTVTATAAASATAATDDVAQTTAPTRIGNTNQFLYSATRTANNADSDGQTFRFTPVCPATACTTNTAATFATSAVATGSTASSLAMASATGIFFGAGATYTTVIPANTTSASTVAVTADPAVTTLSFTLTGTAAKVYAVTTTPGANTPASRITAPTSVTTLADGAVTFVVTVTTPVAAKTAGAGISTVRDSFTVNVAGTTNNFGYTVTYAAPTAAWTLSPAATSNARVLEKSTNTVTAVLTDVYGRILANKAYTVSVAGRNVSASAGVTSAAGVATYTFTDADTRSYSTTTGFPTDTVTFSHTDASGDYTAVTGAVTYTYVATLAAVGSVVVTIPAATRVDQVRANPAAPTAIAYTATVRLATGAAAGAGILVTFAGSADDLFLNGVNTGVTNASGQATVSAYRNKTGFQTITATANGVSGSGASVLWSNDPGAYAADGAAGANPDASDARNVAVTATQSIVGGSAATVVATVTDRWGNPVQGVLVTWSLSGVGRAVTGADLTVGTDTNGQAQIQVTSLDSETGTMTATATIPAVGGAIDLAGKVVRANDAGTGFDASVDVAGVTAGNFRAAGTVIFTKNTSVSTADALLELAKAIGTGKSVEEAADAAAEAIDAANAATDAANLAAEAADAATVAAEEARDAADAATAAVEELATQVASLMSALKAQLTTLANTVAKIAKKVKA